MTIKYNDLDFPLRFNRSSNLSLTNSDKTIEDNIKNSVMILKYGIPLSELGSSASDAPFDPNDLVTAEVLSEEVAESVALGEPRVLINETPRIITNGTTEKMSLVFDYLIKQKNDGWKSVRLALPEFRTDVKR